MEDSLLLCFLVAAVVVDSLFHEEEEEKKEKKSGNLFVMMMMDTCMYGAGSRLYVPRVSISAHRSTSSPFLTHTIYFYIQAEGETVPAMCIYI